MVLKGYFMPRRVYLVSRITGAFSWGVARPELAYRRFGHLVAFAGDHRSPVPILKTHIYSGAPS